MGITVKHHLARLLTKEQLSLQNQTGPCIDHHHESHQEQTEILTIKKLCGLKIHFLESSNFVNILNKENEPNKTVDSGKGKACIQEAKKQEQEFCSQFVRNKLVDPYGKTDWKKLDKKECSDMNFEFESC